MPLTSGGRKQPWDKMVDRNARIKLLKGVLRVLDSANDTIRVFACAVHKASYPDSDPMYIAYEQISSRFDMFLSRRKDERGLIVLDKHSQEIDLQNMARGIRRDGNKWGRYLSNIIEVPLFVDSRSSRIIQLADHIAYAVFRRYNADDVGYFNCVEGRFDRREGKIHGLVHYQTYNPRCTCPACLTKQR